MLLGQTGRRESIPLVAFVGYDSVADFAAKVSCGQKKRDAWFVRRLQQVETTTTPAASTGRGQPMGKKEKGKKGSKEATGGSRANEKGKCKGTTRRFSPLSRPFRSLDWSPSAGHRLSDGPRRPTARRRKTPRHSGFFSVFFFRLGLFLASGRLVGAPFLFPLDSPLSPSVLFSPSALFSVGSPVCPTRMQWARL